MLPYAVRESGESLRFLRSDIVLAVGESGRDGRGDEGAEGEHDA